MHSSSYMTLLLIAIIHLYITVTYYCDISLYSDGYFDANKRMERDILFDLSNNNDDLNNFDMFLVLNISYDGDQTILPSNIISTYLSNLLSYSNDHGCETIQLGLNDMYIDQFAFSNSIPLFFTHYLKCQNSAAYTASLVDLSKFADLECNFDPLSTIYESNSCAKQLTTNSMETKFIYVTWRVNRLGGFKVLSYSAISRLISSYDAIPCSHKLESGTFQIASWKLICLVSQNNDMSPDTPFQNCNFLTTDSSNIQTNTRRKLRTRRDLFKSVSVENITPVPRPEGILNEKDLPSNNSTTDSKAASRPVTVYAYTGRYFGINFPQTWQSSIALLNSDATAFSIQYFPPQCDWLVLSYSQSQIFGIPLFGNDSICSSTQFEAVLKHPSNSTTKDSKIMKLVVVNSAAESDIPTYSINTTCLVDLSFFNSYKLNVTSAWTPSILSTLFIVRLASYIPYLTEDDFTVLNATIRYAAGFSDDSVNKVKLFITWYSHKISYDVFHEQFYTFLMERQSDDVSHQFFFALMPDFVVQGTSIHRHDVQESKETSAISGNNNTESDVVAATKGAENRVAVIVTSVIISVLVILMVIWLVLRRRRKKYSYHHHHQSSISSDNTYTRRRKPAYTADEMMLAKFHQPSRPNIFSNEVLGAIINNTFHHSHLQEEPVIGHSYSSSSPSEEEEAGPSHSRGGSYHFQTYDLVSNADMSSTGDDTIASSFDYTSYHPHRLISSSKKAE